MHPLTTLDMIKSTRMYPAGFDHFCLVVESDDIQAVQQQLAAAGITAEPQFDGVVVKRFGAQGNASSIYIRDPGELRDALLSKQCLVCTHMILKCACAHVQACNQHPC
jgi:extradiol dioxygenase family protein